VLTSSTEKNERPKRRETFRKRRRRGGNNRDDRGRNPGEAQFTKMLVPKEGVEFRGQITFSTAKTVIRWFPANRRSPCLSKTQVPPIPSTKTSFEPIGCFQKTHLTNRNLATRIEGNNEVRIDGMRTANPRWFSRENHLSGELPTTGATIVSALGPKRQPFPC
jgi:hypothetical protein